MAVGKKLVYFPNFIFTMVRTSLPPNQVAFRVPINLSKLDIRDYLSNLYKLNVRDVRTMNYQGVITRDRQTRKRFRKSSYKKAIVTLDQEFEYPSPLNPEDFGKERAEAAISLVKNKLKGWRIRAPFMQGKKPESLQDKKTE